MPMHVVKCSWMKQVRPQWGGGEEAEENVKTHIQFET